MLGSPFIPLSYTSFPVAYTGELSHIVHPPLKQLPLISPKQPLKNNPKDQFLSSNQPIARLPQKSWQKAGLDETKENFLKDLGWACFISCPGALKIGSKKIALSLKGFAGPFFTWLSSFSAATFVRGVSQNQPTGSPASNRIENGWKEARQQLPGLLTFSSVFLLATRLTLPSWKLSQPNIVKGLKWIAPGFIGLILSGSFAAGAYQFGKPTKDQRS